MKSQHTIRSLETLGVLVAALGVFATWQMLQAATSLALAPAGPISEVPIAREIQVLPPAVETRPIAPEVQPIELESAHAFVPRAIESTSQIPVRSEWIDLVALSPDALPEVALPQTEMVVPVPTLDEALTPALPTPEVKITPKPAPKPKAQPRHISKPTPRRVAPRPVVEPQPTPEPVPKKRRAPSIMERRLKPGR